MLSLNLKAYRMSHLPTIETLTFPTDLTASVQSPPHKHLKPASGVPCFVEGTKIMTPNGYKQVERLNVEDKVLTRDNGFQPVAWVGQRTTQPSPACSPVLVEAGTLGAATPTLVSPFHRILMRTCDIGEERFVKANALARLKGNAIRCTKGRTPVTYVHIAFEAHQIICGNGIWSESFYPTEDILAALRSDERRILARTFPTLEQRGVMATLGRKARRTINARDLPHDLLTRQL